MIQNLPSKMEIDWKPGNKCDKDRKILVTTKDKELFSIFKLSLLTNQLAINELIIKKSGNWPRFLLKEAIIGSIEMAEAGIDWAEESSNKHILKLCKKVHLKPERINPLLRKIQQQRLSEYKNGFS